ncbi:MAG: SgcJ/EcaC family oxidoreductase [Ferruginibacter sp.]|nr:SgcJ/EcaC family oxidoreductase [Chitinophagaceae bacterium]
MKSIFLTITAFTLLTMSTLAQTNTGTDDTQIRELVKTIEDGWTKKDGNLFAKPFADDADYVVINGMYIKGKKAIAGGHQAIFDSFYKETNIKTEVQSIRYIRPDIAIVHFTSHMTGTSNGQKVDGRGRITVTAEKTATGWGIVAFQNTSIQDNPGR